MFSIGSNLLSAAMVVVVFSIFAVALTHSYHVYAERCGSLECFEKALESAEVLRNRMLVEKTSLSFIMWVGGFSEMLEKEGLSLKIEVGNLQGETLLELGTEPDALTSYLAPPVSVSLPATFSWGGFSAAPCELTVSVWRG